jgi:hypothetical protein
MPRKYACYAESGVSALPESPVDFKSDHYFTSISKPCEE